MTNSSKMYQLRKVLPIEIQEIMNKNAVKTKLRCKQNMPNKIKKKLNTLELLQLNK